MLQNALTAALLVLAGLLVCLWLLRRGLPTRKGGRRTRSAQEELNRLSLGNDPIGEVTESQTAAWVGEGETGDPVEYREQLDPRLRELLELAVRATDSRAAFLLEASREGTMCRVRFSTEVEEGWAENAERPAGLAGEVFREEREISVSQPDRPLPALPWCKRQPELHSLLAVPVKHVGGNPWACVLDHSAPGHFDDRKRQIARGVAEQMGHWLASTRQLAALALLSLDLRLLHQASTALSHELRVDQILQEIAEFCRLVTPFDTCVICLLGEGQEEFTVAFAEGYPEGIKGAAYSLDALTWAGRLLRSSEEALVVRSERRSSMPILYAGEKVPAGASLLGIVLRAKNRARGVVLLSRKGAAFSQNDAEVLKTHCNQAAVALENAQVHEKVEQMAATDSLTGLFNRRYFDGALEREIARIDRSRGTLALILLDIDHFKDLNDTHGHAMGDVALKKVAELVGRQLRRGDVLARFGGEEFVVLLPEATPAGAQELAERIRRTIAGAAIHPGGPRQRVTVSVGWALYPKDTLEAGRLVELADRALYFAKDSGRNRVAGYHVLRFEGDELERKD